MLSEHLLEEIIGIVHQCGEIMLSATDIDRKMHQKTGKGNFVTEYDSRVQQVLEEKLLALENASRVAEIVVAVSLKHIFIG